MSEPTLFTKIIEGEIPGDFVHRDEHCVVIRDINPQAPVHLLVIPIKPLVGIQGAEDEDQSLLGTKEAAGPDTTRSGAVHFRRAVIPAPTPAESGATEPAPPTPVPAGPFARSGRSASVRPGGGSV